MTTYTFSVRQLHVFPIYETYENVVGRVEWKIEFDRNGVKSLAMGDTLLPYPADPQTFVPIGEVTESLVETWVLQVEGGQPFLNGLQSFHDRMIDSKERSTQLSKWNAPLTTLNTTTSTYEVDPADEAAFISSKKETLKLTIDRERERLGALPINVNGANWDVDDKGLRNINGWLEKLRFDSTIPANFAWRDADNNFVPFATGAALESALSAVLSANVLRGTALYQTAWTKKAEVDAINTVAAISTYDPLTGW